MKQLAFISITAFSLLIVGCGDSDSLGDNGAPLCDDTAVAFDAPVETFVVNENMQRTSSWDYLQGIQATSSITPEVQGMITLMEEFIDTFAVYEGPVTGISSLDNPLDIMEQTVASDEVGNIQSGKQQMTRAINDNVTCKYNNPSAFLHDSDDTLYRYVLDYTFVSTENTLSRTAGYYEPVGNSNEFKATSLTALDPATFSASGYNPPLASTINWFDSTGSLTLTKNYQSQTDSSAYVSETPFTVGGNEVKRFRIALDYQTLEANVYTSEFISAVICFPDTVNETAPIYDPTAQDLIDIGCENLSDRKPYIDPGYGFAGDTPPIPLETYTGSVVSNRQ